MQFSWLVTLQSTDIMTIPVTKIVYWDRPAAQYHMMSKAFLLDLFHTFKCTYLSLEQYLFHYSKVFSNPMRSNGQGHLYFLGIMDAVMLRCFNVRLPKNYILEKLFQIDKLINIDCWLFNYV